MRPQLAAHRVLPGSRAVTACATVLLQAVTPGTDVTPLPALAEQHVTGMIGGGLQLAGARQLKFKRGCALPDAGPAAVKSPGWPASIEFWFRPNWTALTGLFAGCSVEWRLVSAGNIARTGVYGQERQYGTPMGQPVLLGGACLASRGVTGNSAMRRLFPAPADAYVTWEWTRAPLPGLYNHSIYVNGRCRQVGGGDMLRSNNPGRRSWRHPPNGSPWAATVLSTNCASPTACVMPMTLIRRARPSRRMRRPGCWRILTDPCRRERRPIGNFPLDDLLND